MRTITRIAYDFHRLDKPGASIVFAPDSFTYATLAAAAYTYGKRHGWRCNVERTADGGVRVWRDRPLRDTAADKRIATAQAIASANSARLLSYVRRAPGQTAAAIADALGLDIAAFSVAVSPLITERLLEYRDTPEGLRAGALRTLWPV